jgi:drug/metabolite transporter (DMT)-like permease
LFGVMQALIYLLLYRGFAKGQLAILNPVFSSFSGITAILSISILGETVSGGQWFALAMLFVGIMAISLDLRTLPGGSVRFAHVPGLPEICIATVVAALWTLGWNRFIEGKDWVSYAAIMYGFMTAAILVVALSRRTPLSIQTLSVWPYMLLIGVCETVAYCSISLGYSLTPRTSVVALISGAFSLPTIILAHTFLNERIARIQTVGISMIVCGIALVSVL